MVSLLSVVGRCFHVLSTNTTTGTVTNGTTVAYATYYCTTASKNPTNSFWGRRVLCGVCMVVYLGPVVRVVSFVDVLMVRRYEAKIPRYGM